MNKRRSQKGKERMKEKSEEKKNWGRIDRDDEKAEGGGVNKRRRQKGKERKRE